MKRRNEWDVRIDPLADWAKANRGTAHVARMMTLRLGRNVSTQQVYQWLRKKKRIEPTASNAMALVHVWHLVQKQDERKGQKGT